MPYNNLTDRSESAALIPEEVTQEIFKNVEEQSAVMSLARRLPPMSTNVTRMPVLATLPEAYFVAGSTQTARDYGLKQTTDVAWKNKYVYAEEIAAILPVPQNVIDDVAYDIWDETMPLLSEAIAKRFDEAVMFGTRGGSDYPSGTWPDDMLTAAIAAGNSVELGSAGTDLWDDIMSEDGVIAKLESDSFIATGHIAAVSFKSKLRGLRDENGQPLFATMIQDRTRYELDGMPIAFPRHGGFLAAEAHLFCVDFSQIVTQVRKDITFEVFREGVVQNAAGVIQYNLMQQDMVAMRVTFRAGWQVPNPASRLQPNEADRYPAAVLLPTA